MRDGNCETCITSHLCLQLWDLKHFSCLLDSCSVICKMRDMSWLMLRILCSCDPKALLDVFLVIFVMFVGTWKQGICSVDKCVLRREMRLTPTQVSVEMSLQ